jgi:hypothetical protein
MGNAHEYSSFAGGSDNQVESILTPAQQLSEWLECEFTDEWRQGLANAAADEAIRDAGDYANPFIRNAARTAALLALGLKPLAKWPMQVTFSTGTLYEVEDAAGPGQALAMQVVERMRGAQPSLEAVPDDTSPPMAAIIEAELYRNNPGHNPVTQN